MSTTNAPTSLDRPIRPAGLRHPDWRRWYVPLRVRVWLTFVLGFIWLCLSAWLSRHWIVELGHDITLPMSILVITGVALIPGYLNVQLLTGVLLDKPRPLRLEGIEPGITLLVAAYNEEAAIEETLDYTLRSDYQGELRVVVADDGSTDATRDLVQAYADRDPRVQLFCADHGGKANTLSSALMEVDTPLVATIDADTLLMPYSLSRAVARLRVSPADTVAVAGSVLARNSRKNLLTRAQEWDYFLGIASVKRVQSLLQGTLVAQGAFSVYRTSALKSVGGWPNRIGEDIVLTWRLLLRGGRSVFEPTAVAFTEVPDSWESFVRQRRRWARGMIEGLRDHGVGLVRQSKLYSHAVGANFLFPYLDCCFTFAFLPGLVLACTGNFMLVGPMTLLVLPLNGLISAAMYVRQRTIFNEVGLRVRRNRSGFVFYVLLYQFVMAPVSVAGYFLELTGARRHW
ncbi:MAG TPA: glycosyltransferase family 2 protein [Solirubrobacteraceae bacterium]|nr:glycosyltransferase family 2 protein [Solirubrobacteraceae bacterium]